MKQKKILLNHGSGGKVMHELISDLFIKHFNNNYLKAQTDSAILTIDNNLLAYTTDSYVVTPIFFPGGNIGKLAICGTVNDLAVSAAKPLFISAGFIIEEGLDYSELEQIVKSMANEAIAAGVTVVTGDTKVVEKGKCDKLFINTSGIGVLNSKYKTISTGNSINCGDKIIVSGTVGDHGASILCARNAIEYTSNVISDCASLNVMVQEILEISDNIKFMRDATRGGLTTVLCELSERLNIGIVLYESLIPIQESVRGLCELFGYDPLYMANEGKIVIVVSSDDADKVVSQLHTHTFGKNAAIIGEITSNHQAKVVLNTIIGGTRIIDLPAGEQLPRIC